MSLLAKSNGYLVFITIFESESYVKIFLKVVSKKNDFCDRLLKSDSKSEL